MCIFLSEESHNQELCGNSKNVNIFVSRMYQHATEFLLQNVNFGLLYRGNIFAQFKVVQDVCFPFLFYMK